MLERIGKISIVAFIFIFTSIILWDPSQGYNTGYDYGFKHKYSQFCDAQTRIRWMQNGARYQEGLLHGKEAAIDFIKRNGCILEGKSLWQRNMKY